MSGDEGKDPVYVWDLVKPFVNSSNVLSPAVVDGFLVKLPQLFSSFPQILVSTPRWPDTQSSNARRRRAFREAIVRRVAHLVVQKEGGDQTREVEAVVSMLEVLEDRQPTVWRNLLLQLILFSQRLAESSQQDLKTPGSSQSCQIIEAATEDLEDEEEMFNKGLNTVVLTDFIVTERLQALVTRIITRQLKFSLDLSTNHTIHSVALTQLEVGGAELKAVSLELLAAFHKSSGCGETWQWAVECELLVQLLKLLSSPDILPEEVETLSSAWSLFLSSTLPLLDRDHLLILSIPLIPFWQSQSNLASLPPQTAGLVSRAMQKIVGQLSKTSDIREVATTHTSPDWELLGSLAVSEVLKSASFRESGDSGETLCAAVISPAWSFLLANIEGNLSQLSELEMFSAIVRNLLIAVIEERPEVRLEILSLSLMAAITEKLRPSLLGSNAGPSLTCVEVMMQSSHLLPPNPHLIPLQQSWAALLSLPWLSLLPGGKDADLAIAADLRAALANNMNSVGWSPGDSDRALRLLGFLPANICPRFRLSVYQTAWQGRAVGVVQSLPSVIALSSSAAEFAREVCRNITGRLEQMEVVLSLAEVSTPIICSLAKRTVINLASPAQGELQFSLRCLDCSASSEEDCTTTTSSATVASTELESLLRLVGHQDRRVRLKLVQMIPTAARHCILTPEAANLWTNSVSDNDQEVRFSFASNVGFILRCRRDTLSGDLDEVIVRRLQELLPTTADDTLDSYILTLVSVSSALTGTEMKVRVLDLLLELYINQATTVHTSVNALPTLRSAMKNEKHHILEWSARLMCSGHHQPQTVLAYLLLLCMEQTEKKDFLLSNLRHLLPTIILNCSAAEGNPGVDAALKMISGETNQRPELILMYNFPVIFRTIIIKASNQTHLKTCIEYLEKKIDRKFCELFQTNRQMVLVELITMFQSNKARIIKGLAMCAMVDDNFKHREKKKGAEGGGNLPQEVVAEYVAGILPALLASFITICSKETVRTAEKTQCLKSLDQLMAFLKYKNLQSCKYALMDCMKLATNLSKTNEAFEEIALQLWSTFINEFPLSALLGVLPQILCKILPHLHTSPLKTLKMFRILLMDNVDQIRGQQNSLMFLRRIPELDEILSSVLGRELELRETIQGLIDCLDSESVDVRLQSLTTLSLVLENNMGGVQGLVVCSDRTDPLVTRLITSLVRALSSKEPDAEVRYLASLCLGKLGPVDPGRLDFVVDLGGVETDISSRNALLDVFSVGFCTSLLQELVRAQASAREPLIAENCSYSIQEVLKLYNINLNSSNPADFAYRVWRALSDSTQEKLTPLLTSLYKHQPGSRPSLSSPLYLSTHGRTYRDWLVNWTMELVALISDNRKRELFEACLPALKKDLTIGDLLLPRIIIEVLCDCKAENNEMLLTEIKYIIENTNLQQPEEKNLQQSVAAALFLVQDYIRIWTRTKFSSLLAATRKSESQLKPEDIKAAVSRSKEYANVVSFVSKISNEVLANFCYEVRAYPRSAFHFDLYLKQKPQSNLSCLASLQRLYVALEEPELASDLVLGVKAVREEPSLREQVELHQATGNYPDALDCLQLLMAGGRESPSTDLKLVRSDTADLIQCYLNMDQPGTASALAAQLSREKPDVAEDLTNLQAEAAWQLGHWDQLEALSSSTSSSTSTGWQLGLGKLLLAIKKEDWVSMRGQVELLRKEVVGSITSSGNLEHGAYQTSYREVNQLGMLNEVQLITDKFLCCSTKQLSSASLGSSELLSSLRTRLSYTQSSWTSLEPVLRLRRCCLSLAEVRVRPYNSKLADRLQYEVGECWLQSAQIARRSGLLQQSFSLLMEARQCKNNQTFEEAAKLDWERDQKTTAIKRLKDGLTDSFPEVEAALLQENSRQPSKTALENVLRPLSNSERDVLCRGKMLLAQYLEEAASVSNDDIGTIYQHAKTIAKNNEEVFFRYGRSIDKQIQLLTAEQQLQHSDLVVHTCANYLRSIINGPTHLYHCLPRMLTIWLDFAEVVHEAVEADTKKSTERVALLENASRNLDKILQTLKSWLKQSPVYYLLTALPQIVSRICHQHQGSYHVLSSMMVSLLASQYSQQTFWHMVSVSKNSDKNRRSRCQNIFLEAIRKNSDLKSFLNNAQDFAKKLDELCELKTEQGIRKLSLKQSFKSLPALVKMSSFSGSLILPIEKNMMVTLPTVEGKSSNHSPFPSGLVYIDSISDDVTVMPSLVRPKKIILRGSDGRDYPFLAKPQDDLRRDSRLMDCICMLNKLFLKDDRARGRNLHIRTYTVVSTNETSGLIEWVDNLKGIRQILLQLYKENGLNLSNSWSNKFLSHDQASLEEKRKNLERCVAAQGGAVFSRWFVENFSDPQSWLMARMAYVRSTAVISMMGYIIGLGDRHLENINVDTKSGETFHVDMNCLFNKGETMKVPEVVPFRLTHNMVDAFGPLGVEGPFRIACEIALSVMRKEKDLIMSVLRPFVYDPLVDWRKSKSGKDEGTSHLKRVEDRLSGIVTDSLVNLKAKKRKKSLLGHPLSVEGQVNHLILEATDLDNLAVMYWGWAPYL